ncbi:MAG: hypothetical protein JW969_02550 [Spirochaetales bacterium]|nr:hypothetical protein [Spirochaetales bacterium]
MIPIFIIVIAFIIFFFFFNLLLSHGKFKFSHLLFGILYGLSVGLPITFAGYFKWFYKTSIDPYIFLLLSVLALIPFLYTKWYNIIRGRESPFQAILFTIAIILFFVSFFIEAPFNFSIVIIGWIFLITYFVDVFRYPYLNSTWLAVMVDETAKEVQTRGKYSAKPVTLFKPIGKRFVTGTLGISLISKTDRVIARISKKLHKKLGSPNLEVFFTQLINKIQSKSP